MRLTSMLRLDAQQDKAGHGSGLDSFHLSHTFRSSRGTGTAGPKKPLRTKQEERWFEIGNEAVAYKARTGEWGKFSNWLNTARKSWSAVRLSEDQIAFFRKHKISFTPNEADKTASGAKPKQGSALSRLFDLYDRRDELVGTEAEELEKRLKMAEMAYSRGEVTVVSHRTARRLGFDKKKTYG